MADSNGAIRESASVGLGVTLISHIAHGGFEPPARPLP
jgi:hypothetical protein